MVMRRTACSLQFQKQLIFRCIWEKKLSKLVATCYTHTLIPAWLHRKKSNSVGWQIFLSTTVPANSRNIWAKSLLKNTLKNSNKHACTPNQVEYFHSCLSIGDHLGRALCDASSAPLWRWSLASHCKELSMPEGMVGIKYECCNWGNTWCAILSICFYLLYLWDFLFQHLFELALTYAIPNGERGGGFVNYHGISVRKATRY